MSVRRRGPLAAGRVRIWEMDCTGCRLVRKVVASPARMAAVPPVVATAAQQHSDTRHTTRCAHTQNTHTHTENTHTENTHKDSTVAHTAAKDVLDRHFEAVAEVDGRVDGVDGQLQACKRIEGRDIRDALLETVLHLKGGQRKAVAH